MAEAGKRFTRMTFRDEVSSTRAKTYKLTQKLVALFDLKLGGFAAELYFSRIIIAVFLTVVLCNGLVPGPGQLCLFDT